MVLEFSLFQLVTFTLDTSHKAKNMGKVDAYSQMVTLMLENGSMGKGQVRVATSIRTDADTRARFGIVNLTVLAK